MEPWGQALPALILSWNKTKGRCWTTCPEPLGANAILEVKGPLVFVKSLSEDICKSLNSLLNQSGFYSSMHVCGVLVCMFACMGACVHSMWKPEADGRSHPSPIILLLYHSLRVSWADSGLKDMTSLADSLLGGSFASTSWGQNYRRAATNNWCFCGFWGSELWPSRLPSNHFNNQAIP